MLQHRLAGAGEEERGEEIGVGLVGEQVGVVGAVRGGSSHERRVEDGPNLRGVAERRRAGRLEFVERLRRASAESRVHGAASPVARRNAAASASPFWNLGSGRPSEKFRYPSSLAGSVLRDSSWKMPSIRGPFLSTPV